MAFTLYYAKKVLDAEIGDGTGFWLSLHTGNPGPSGSHAFEITTSGSGYIRQSMAGMFGATDAGSGIKINTSIINFGPATTNWGSVDYVALEDAVSAGNMVWIGSPSLPRIINDGLPFQIANGQIRLRLI